MVICIMGGEFEYKLERKIDDRFLTHQTAVLMWGRFHSDTSM